MIQVLLGHKKIDTTMLYTQVATGEYMEISYNSCRNRHCPKCQARAAQRWLEAR